MYFKTSDVAGLGLFYREAGNPSKPSIVLLHGCPSSSRSRGEPAGGITSALEVTYNLLLRVVAKELLP